MTLTSVFFRVQDTPLARLPVAEIMIEADNDLRALLWLIFQLANLILVEGMIEALGQVNGDVTADDQSSSLFA